MPDRINMRFAQRNINTVGKLRFLIADAVCATAILNSQLSILNWKEVFLCLLL